MFDSWWDITPYLVFIVALVIDAIQAHKDFD